MEPLIVSCVEVCSLPVSTRLPEISETETNWKLKQESEVSGRNPLHHTTARLPPLRLMLHCRIGFILAWLGYVQYVFLDGNWHREKSSDCSRFLTENEAKHVALDYAVILSRVSSICGSPRTCFVLSSNLLLWQKYETSSLQLRKWHFRWLQYSYDSGTGFCLYGSS